MEGEAGGATAARKAVVETSSRRPMAMERAALPATPHSAKAGAEATSRGETGMTAGIVETEGGIDSSAMAGDIVAIAGAAGAAAEGREARATTTSEAAVVRRWE